MYMIESYGSGNERSPDWDECYVTGDSAANRFATEDEAWRAVAELQSNGDEWAGDHYRVVEVEN